MKIVYLKLVNFIGVKAATGLNEIELKYDHIKQSIIQLFGKNRCGKTVLIQQHHPFSSINLTGDERSDLSLIIPNEIGIKNIVYEHNGKVYNITHPYRPSGKSHTVSSSILEDGVELNSNGGVNTFNAIVERVLGINKYILQFIINGTNLTSFAGMGATQRKTVLNKAMGIDIYDKIHKLATDDYRFTSKLIASLNHTKEYLLQTYGSYETLFATLDQKRNERDKLAFEIETMKSRLDSLNGSIQTLQQQNPELEMVSICNSISEYTRALDEIGGVFNPDYPEQLMNEQIAINSKLSELRADRTIIMKEIDDLYDKLHTMESSIQSVTNARNDCESMENLIQSLTDKIDQIHIEVDIEASSQYLFSMLSLAQAINTTCNEIVTSIKMEHLELLVEMVEHGVDVSAFLLQEGAAVLDSEKERSIISFIRTMIQSVEGEIPSKSGCTIENCLYRNTFDALESYFNSFQSQTKGKFTQYDLEQFDHAFKNVQTVRRLLPLDELDKSLRDIFSLRTILHRLLDGRSGIDVDYIKYLIEEAAKSEQRVQYIKQLHETEQSLALMKEKMNLNIDEASVDTLKDLIQQKTEQKESIEATIESLTSQLEVTDHKRVLIANVQRIDVHALEKRRIQLEQTIAKLKAATDEYQQTYGIYQSKLEDMRLITNELDVLEKAFDQYVKTSSEIDQHTTDDQQFKAIAEATSSTKGMPVIAIRDVVDKAIATANKLLTVMYDDEIELLRPVIDETSFSLPFRCGNNKSYDIRYGSQSESTLLSLALSLSLSSSMSIYNVITVDELDAYLDASIRDDFIIMLETLMGTLGMEQMFLISHNLQKGQFTHIVHSVDINELINQQKGAE